MTFVGLLYGILNSIFGGGFYALWRQGSAAGAPWWFYVLAVPVLGAAWLIFEVVGEAVGSVIFAPYTWRRDPMPWKRSVYWLVIFVTLGVALALFTSPLWLANLGSTNAI
ncbi:hypothetical protein BWI17_03910 [Betaproteobacteria bacterium GR16-43]|nr:hypothetical protein BWI17_03910 [Betaproteobacteria bacterium GR16-43]